MGFQVQPVKEFLVRPALPATLARMSELAYNFLWTWEPTIRQLFRRLDPELWRETGHNPVAMLGRVPQATLERMAADPRYLALYRRACERYDAYVHRQEEGRPELIAYFSMEYGLSECLPVYSGGLGVLSGDFLKSCSDAGIRLVGVGLLYQTGYFQQYLNPDGWQQEKFPVSDFYMLPVEPVVHEGRELRVEVEFPGGKVFIKVWQASVGRVKLYLLDTNIPENARPEHREITARLYDDRMRIQQEIVLGIGGLRALKALGLEPTVFHMNEGHSAFLALERIRMLVREEGLSFEEALEATRSNNIFTTHTSVPAGIDIFDPNLMQEYFRDFCREVGIGFEQFMALGRRNPSDPHERFTMAILAIKTSAWRNAVSRLHRQVSQEMWQDLWPELPVWEVPITSITNGVHLRTWLSSDLAMLYDQYLQPDWQERISDPETWRHIEDIPDQELWEAHRRAKRRMVAFIRERQLAFARQRKASAAELRRAGEVLDPEAFTIGFARRFATYKRATLLFRDVGRLKRLLTNPERPVQIVVAGKAHPKDHPGREMIRHIVQLSRDPELAKRLVFIEDYDMHVARQLVQACDLWLNTPRRGEEACGTSGMKAGINGVLNLSVLDGWFDEAYEISGGWAVGDRMPYAEDQDEAHATAIYSLLENEIVPAFFDRDQGVPREWMRRMKRSIMSLSPQFNCQRMVDEYMTQLYRPAHEAYREMRADGFRKAREHVSWRRRVQQIWEKVRFLEVTSPVDGPLLSGRPLPVRAVVDLAGLRPEDVRVEVVLGRVGPHGELQETEVLLLPPVEERGGVAVFEREVIPQQTGRLGYSVRIAPNHYGDPLNRPSHALLKWARPGS
ncbi:MAG: alpha-glucan family phosphorylase [Bryobacterales bacterium]|nr:alpha-glucan family phosphorylase [Bryobacteraceae bacterium]MDW8130740.1 alpha-glucan family phosphorylase [Bryobacterales bacterium]